MESRRIITPCCCCCCCFVSGIVRFNLIKLIIVILISLNCQCRVDCKYIEGEIETSENWIFLTRFCFYSLRGQFKYEIEYPLSYAVQNILLYYDSPTQWPAVYKKQKTCKQKESVLSQENRQIVNLSENLDISGCHVTSDILANGSRKLVTCSGERRFETVRERWWFIAISNCDSTKGLKMKYKITMTNGDPGDYRFEHFSADEFKILEMSLAFLILNVILFVMTVGSSVVLRQRHLLHTTFKIFMLSLAFYCFSLLLNFIAYLKYAFDGIGLPNVKCWGQVLHAISLTQFLLLLLLLAKGYTVTRARLRPASALKVALFMVTYSLTYAILFIYKDEMFDPGDVVYMYESPPGYGLVMLRSISWFMFVVAILFTLKHYPEKAPFYYPFLAFFSLWFLAGPILTLAANFVIDKWAREKVVFGTEASIAFLAYVIFWCMTIPSMTNVNFPYHVRTTQIGAADAGVDYVTGSPPEMRNLDAFVHHQYAPSAPPAPPPCLPSTYDLFVIGANTGTVPVQPQSLKRPPIMATGRSVHPQLWPAYHNDETCAECSNNNSVSRHDSYSRTDDVIGHQSSSHVGTHL